MYPNLDLDLLRSFSVVAETRNFTRAAERLNRVQSAVSMQVKRLEDVVGVKVFDRTRRSVKLTPDGVVLLRHARRMLTLNEQALADFGKQAVEGRVRLGATDTTMCFLPAVLSRFAQDHPLIELEIGCDRSWEALDALEAGEVDLALITQPCGRAGGRVVRREPLRWAVAENSVVDEQDPVPLAIFAPGCIYRDAALKALETMGRDCRHAYNSSSRDGLDVAVMAGLAVTIMPESALVPGLRVIGSGQGFPTLPQIEILLYETPGESPAPVATFADILVKTLAQVTRNTA